MKTSLTHSREETVEIGKTFAATLSAGDVVAIYGSLGSGKTQFVVGICAALAVRGHVASPTFTIINEYPASFGMVVHIDLYRITSQSEIAELGIEEYFRKNCVCVIEWPEAVRDLLPEHHYAVRMNFGKRENEREIVIEEVHGVTA